MRKNCTARKVDAKAKKKVYKIRAVDIKAVLQMAGIAHPYKQTICMCTYVHLVVYMLDS